MRWTASLLALMLSGCAATAPIREVPANMLEPVEVPQRRGNTNADLAHWAIDLREALQQANARIDAIKETLSHGK